MATVPSPQTRLPSLRPKLVLFTCIGLMLAYVLYHDEHYVIDPADPIWAHYRDIGKVLLPHGLIGAFALLLAFMQFNAGLRARHPLVHRVSGRIYVGAVIVVAPLGAVLGSFDQAIGYTRAFSIATIVQGALWSFATLTAFFCIKTRRVEQHRQWMTRSLSVALVFVTDRVLSGLTGWDKTPATDTIAAWICIALAYPLADTALLIEDLWRPQNGVNVTGTRPAASIP